MTKVPKYWNKAKKYLSKKDKVMSKLIKNYQSPSEIVLISRKDIFFLYVKVLLDNKLVLLLLIQFFLNLKKNVMVKLNQKQFQN